MEECLGLFHFPSLSPQRESFFKRTKPVRLTLGFAIANITLGIVSAVLQIANLSTKTYAPSNYLCFGVWCGFLYVVAGGLTVDAIVFSNIRARMTLATLTSGVSLIFATLATVWSIQDRIYVHYISREIVVPFAVQKTKQNEDQCFQEWMQTFQVTVHISLVVISCLAVVSNLIIFLVQASTLLNTRDHTNRQTFDQVFALPQLSLISTLRSTKNPEKQSLLKNSRFSGYHGGYTRF